MMNNNGAKNHNVEKINIVRCSSTEMDQLRIILIEGFGKEYTGIIPWFDQHKEEFNSDIRPVWLLILNKKIIGFYIAHVINKNRLKGNALYVKPEYRCNGYGDLLITTVENFVKSNGMKIIYFSIFSDLEGTVKFFQKRGYIAVRQFRDRENSSKMRLLMEKEVCS